VKTLTTSSLGLALVFLFAGRSFADDSKAPPAKAAAAALPPRAVFTQPASPREGRDPFFPESTRVFDSQVAQHAALETATTLSVKGFSIVNGRPMVIINNHSFMAGDEGDVLSGPNRAHVRCLEITAGTVIVEVNGSRHVLHF
jgi:hypothetical protein